MIGKLIKKSYVTVCVVIWGQFSAFIFPAPMVMVAYHDFGWSLDGDLCSLMVKKLNNLDSFVYFVSSSFGMRWVLRVFFNF